MPLVCCLKQSTVDVQISNFVIDYIQTRTIASYTRERRVLKVRHLMVHWVEKHTKHLQVVFVSQRKDKIFPEAHLLASCTAVVTL